MIRLAVILESWEFDSPLFWNQTQWKSRNGGFAAKNRLALTLGGYPDYPAIPARYRWTRHACADSKRKPFRRCGWSQWSDW